MYMIQLHKESIYDLGSGDNFGLVADKVKGVKGREKLSSDTNSR